MPDRGASGRELISDPNIRRRAGPLPVRFRFSHPNGRSPRIEDVPRPNRCSICKPVLQLQKTGKVLQMQPIGIVLDDRGFLCTRTDARSVLQVTTNKPEPFPIPFFLSPFSTRTGSQPFPATTSPKRRPTVSMVLNQGGKAGWLGAMVIRGVPGGIDQLNDAFPNQGPP